MKQIMRGFFVLLCLLATHPSLSYGASRASYLRKLSMRIKGVPPQARDYQDLKESSDPEAFIHEKIKEYLNSSDHVEQMVVRLEELFQIRISPAPKNLTDESLRERHEFRNSMDEVFRWVVRENLSWDSLLTGKKYTVYYPGAGSRFRLNDLGFFGAVAQDLPPTYVGVLRKLYSENTGPTVKSIDLEFLPDDSRIAGAITTARFYERYTNTPLNKNRRRAAAIFRMFLCDNMVPAIQNGTDRVHALLGLVYPADYEVSMQEAAHPSAEKLHGSRSDCYACHRKLDPLGKAFQGSSLALNPLPSVAALVIPRGAEAFSEKGRGIGDIAKSITKTKEYASCQVDLFWKWFVGEDVALSAERKAQLLQKFDVTDRHVNDFVEQIVTLPEFREPSAHMISHYANQARQVRGIFKNCNQCHQTNPKMPDFTAWPIGAGDSSTWYAKIYFKVFEAKTLPMPPTGPLSSEDQNTLHTWLLEGAPDEAGKTMVDPSQMLRDAQKLKDQEGRVR